MKRFILSLFLVALWLPAITQTCTWTIKNFTQAANNIEFDIYTKAVAPGNYLLCGINIGIDIINYTALANGGVLTGSFVSGSNTLPAPQNNMSDSYIDTVTHQFVVPLSLVTASATMNAISTFPLKIGTFRISNTQTFQCNVSPILYWHLDTNLVQTQLSIIVNNGPCSLPYTQTSFSYSNQGPDYFVDTTGFGSGVSTIYPPYETDTLCPSVPFIWRGDNYFQPGYYHDTVINAVGCDTVYGLHLVPLSGTTPYFSVTQCDTFLWSSNNQVYSSPGTYYNIKTINGCTFTDSFTYVMGSPTVQAPWIANTYAPYTWPVNGQTYLQSGTYYDTSLNSNGCQVITALNLNIITPTSIPEVQTNEILLYPNPTSQELFIETNSSAYKSFTLFTIFGEEVFTSNIDSQNKINRIILPNQIRNGIYVYRVHGIEHKFKEGILTLLK